jgi:hypothetical protein
MKKVGVTVYRYDEIMSGDLPLMTGRCFPSEEAAYQMELLIDDIRESDVNEEFVTLFTPRQVAEKLDIYFTSTGYILNYPEILYRKSITKREIT